MDALRSPHLYNIMYNTKSQSTNTSKSALAAVSGGIDSAVAAMLAQRDGLDCTGVTMILHSHNSSGEADARRTVERLGIPFQVFDFCDSFKTCVIDRFVETYSEGRTPNPCVICNKLIKFGCLMEKMFELKRNYIVTGHYAQIVQNASGRFLLKKGADILKDQSYVLYGLTQQQLSHIKFPLGGLSKGQVREIAYEAGLADASKRESQDICFVPDGDYAGFIEEYTGKSTRKGRFVSPDGKYLGENMGIIHYTVGQRRGLGLAMPAPVYVLDIQPEDDTVIVGASDLLYSRSLRINDINLISADRLDSPVKAHVKIRYRQPGQPAVVRQSSDDTIEIEFDEPQRAITRGQAAVIYDGDIVVGGGTII